MTAPARAFPREAGRGPAVVCVHASASSSAQWRPLMDRLADRYRILAVDLYGSGQSPSWPAVRPLSLADEVALLGPVFATAGERCHLVGHSYGGAVALEAALAAPERVASLVLFEPVLFSVLLAEDPTQPAAREIAAVRDDRAMEGAGPLTAAELGRRTGLRERYVREWLSAQAAGGYVTCDPATGAFTLPPEQAFLLLDADLPGAFQLSVGSVRDEPKITEAFRSGAGVGWHEHDSGVYEGCERFFRPGYAMNLVSQWIPALDGVKARLEVGGRVADVGCGHGASAIIMAQAFPRATITGFDYHPASIEAAPTRAPATTWSRSSTACTTWGTRSGPRATFGDPSPRAGCGCSWSPSPTIASRTISTRSDACTTRPRRCSARRPRSVRRSVSRWAPRPGRSVCARC